MESILKCYECRKTATTEEVEIVTRDGKKYWVCPNCDFETPIADKVAATVQRKGNKLLLVGSYRKRIGLHFCF